MGIFANKGTAAVDGSRSRLVIGLLVLILFLVLGLAWQANRTMQTHNAAATRVLQDYARLVADEYSRRALGNVGYYGYFTYMNLLRRLALEDPAFPFKINKPDPDSPEERAARLVRYMFFIDITAARIQVSAKSMADSHIVDHLLQSAAAFARQALPEAGFAIEHASIDERPHTFVMTKVDDSSRVFGFEVDRSELSEWLRRTFDEAALLPNSLAGGEVTNEFIFLSIADETGRILFDSERGYQSGLLVTKTMQDEYAGIFRGYKINAAIDPLIAGSLVIGGLPRSRLPVLLAVILLTVGLLVTAIRQVQREQAIMKLRTDFVSEVSHELRTPLTQIRMFTETLLFERFNTSGDKRRALEIINRESQRLIHLVENVLRFSDRRADHRELHLVSQVLAPLVTGVVKEFQPLAQSVGVVLQCELDPQASALVDGNALRQILLNLLDNAVKYGPNGKLVQVTVSDHPGAARISVADQGPGIPPADRERIWGGYYRLERERQSAIAGTGIGLAVVRELVDRHGGRTWVENARDGGACFVVEIPKDARQEMSTTVPDRSSPNPDMGNSQ